LDKIIQLPFCIPTTSLHERKFLLRAETNWGARPPPQSTETTAQDAPQPPTEPSAGEDAVPRPKPRLWDYLPRPKLRRKQNIQARTTLPSSSSSAVAQPNDKTRPDFSEPEYIAMENMLDRTEEMTISPRKLKRIVNT
jgi:KAP family P-loop domain